MRGLFSLYSWHYPTVLVFMLQQTEYQPGPYLKWYWQTGDFSEVTRGQSLRRSTSVRLLLLFVWLGIALQILAGLGIIGLWFTDELYGGLAFGMALVVSYPVIWAHVLVLVAALRWLLKPKALGRAIVCRKLESQVRRLRQKHKFTVVAVAGSAGKTSTKLAVARVLQASRRVLWQEGNYNDRVTVPLVFFDQVQPNILNIFAWLRIFRQNERVIRQPYPYDVVVVELGTDGPGFIEEFAYIEPELAVVTAVAPEHMEYFRTLDAVAQEELGVLHFAQRALLNKDDISSQYLEGSTYPTYGLDNKNTYYATRHTTQGLHSQTVSFHLKKSDIKLDIPLLGEQGAKIALAAAGVAHMLGLSMKEIEKGLASISAFMGRMQILPGIKDSTLIDDTYNASPIAVKAALDVVYSGEASQRIAILGSMNELGDHSEEAHREVGEYCDPEKLDLVITVGREAQDFLAPAAKKRGCIVHTFLSPYEAGEFAHGELKDGAVVLAKGSQNGVFAEEALKALLADKADEAKLVRQSAHWMKVKHKQFGRN